METEIKEVKEEAKEETKEEISEQPKTVANPGQQQQQQKRVETEEEREERKRLKRERKRERRKEKKKDKQRDLTKNGGVGEQPPPEPGRCCMWLVKRHRYCHMQRTKDSLYCKAHTPDPTRIVCPLDPNHTVDPAELEKHLKKCPGTRLQKASRLPYYKLDLNTGSDDESDVGSKNNSKKCGKMEDVCSLPTSGDKDSEPVDVESDADICKEADEKRAKLDLLGAMIPKVKAAYAEASRIIPSPPPLEQLYDKAIEDAIPDIEISRKHGPQLISIVAHMKKEGMLAQESASNPAFVELGAGNGKLSRLVGLCAGPPAARVLMVDRGRFRHKAERLLGEDEEKKKSASDIKFERVVIDIKDFDMVNAPFCDDADSLVAFGKHLCGSACDLSLRCLASWIRQAKEPKFCAMTVALCCFHKCEWKSYPSKKWLKSLGFGKREFDVLRTMTSWNTSEYATEKGLDGTNGVTDSKTASGEELLVDGMTKAQLREIGIQARHILAAGRVVFLRELGFDTKVIRYVDEKLSPENLLLLSTWKEDEREKKEKA